MRVSVSTMPCKCLHLRCASENTTSARGPSTQPGARFPNPLRYRRLPQRSVKNKLCRVRRGASARPSPPPPPISRSVFFAFLSVNLRQSADPVRLPLLCSLRSFLAAVICAILPSAIASAAAERQSADPPAGPPGEKNPNRVNGVNGVIDRRSGPGRSSHSQAALRAAAASTMRSARPSRRGVPLAAATNLHGAPPKGRTTA
jgi:hypothetical protein